MKSSILNDANRAFREKHYLRAIELYKQAGYKNPTLQKIINKNIELATKRCAQEKVAPNNKKTIDIVIPVFNALVDTQKCIESIQKNSKPYEPKIIIVNDGSNEETTKWLSQHCRKDKSITLIEHKENKGYTKAINTGLRHSTAAYVITQNSDTIVPPNWLQGLIQCLDFDERIGIAGPLSNAASWQNVPNLKNEDGSFAINEIPHNLSIDEFSKIIKHTSNKRYPRLPFLNGFCFAIKREVINSIGYMDEENFPHGYGEENDYCIRAMDHGYELAVADDTFVFHSKSKSFGHSRRKELSTQGDKALRQKHTNEKVNRLIEATKNTNDLYDTRKAINLYLKHYQKPTSNPSTQKALNSILFILPVGAGGGGGHSVIQEASHLRRLGINTNVAVLHSQLETFLNTYNDIENIKDLLIGFHNAKTDAQIIKNLSFAKNYQIIVATLYSTAKTVKLLTDNFPFCTPAYYIQDYEPFFFEPDSADWLTAHQSYTLLNDAILFAKTEWIANKVKEIHNVNVHKVLPSIDHSVYKPIFRRNNSKIVITAMIRPSSKRRGAERTMKVLNRIANNFPDKCQIKIFGCTNNDPDFKKISSDFPYINKGVLKRKEVSTLLALSDVFIDLSDYQAFGRTALEAMACGCTALVPLEGGSNEYAIDGKNSIVIDTKNEEEIYSRLAELIDNPHKLQELKTNALSTAAKYNIHSAAISEYILFSSFIKKQHLEYSSNRIGTKKMIIMPGLMGDGNPAGSGYVRLLLPYSEKTIPDWTILVSKSKVLPQIGSADAVFLQREMSNIDISEFENWAVDWKEAGGRIFYDIDDDLLNAKELALRINSSIDVAQKRANRIKVFSSYADVVTVSMPPLADLLKPFCKDVRVIPNYLDEDTWWISRPRPNGPDCFPKDTSGKVIRIGYIGTQTHSQDLSIISDAVKMIEAEFKETVSIEIIGGFQPNTTPFGQVITLPKKTEYPNFVEWLGKRVNWDIGLIPLVDDQFNRSKSYLKFLEYSALNLAIICSDVQTYASIAKHEQNCLVAKNTTLDWYGAIKRMILDKKLREKLAAQSHHDVSSQHTIQKNSLILSQVVNH